MFSIKQFSPSNISNSLKQNKIKKNLIELYNSYNALSKEIKAIESSDQEQEVVDMHVSKLKLEKERIAIYFDEVRELYEDNGKIKSNKDLWKLNKPSISFGSMFLISQELEDDLSLGTQNRKSPLLHTLKETIRIPEYHFELTPNLIESRHFYDDSIRPFFKRALIENEQQRKIQHLCDFINARNIKDLNNLEPIDYKPIIYDFVYNFICHIEKHNIAEYNNLVIYENLYIFYIDVIKLLAKHYRINIIITTMNATSEKQHNYTYMLSSNESEPMTVSDIRQHNGC